MSRIKISKCKECNGKVVDYKVEPAIKICRVCNGRGKVYIDRLYSEVIMSWRRQRNRLKSR